MDNKEKLKEKLLEIPMNYRAFREKYRLASDLNIALEDIEPLLNELVEKKILKKKVQYICPNCRDTTTMDDELLKEILNEDEGDCFPCDNCTEYIDPTKDTTGYIFYDIEDEQALIEW